MCHTWSLEYCSSTHKRHSNNNKAEENHNLEHAPESNVKVLVIFYLLVSDVEDSWNSS